ncbi:MAG: ABC transporter permease [Egibacteraceae bacterium]
MAIASVKLGELWESRELLANLVGKELKVRYKSSALGFLWSLLTPLLMTGVFTVVFAVFLRVPLGMGNFATFFLGGFLVWQFFANSVNASVGAIVGNAPLVKKVYFPREVLPLSLVLSQGVHLLLALIATAPLFIHYRGFHPQLLPAIALGLALLVAFTAGVSMLFAAANVSFRDLQELIQVLFLAWFYATPVIYPLFFLDEGTARRFLPLIWANPMTWYVELFHRLLYGVPGSGVNPPPGMPDPRTWAVCAVWAVAAVAAGSWLFQRRAVTFAKEV